MGTKATTAKRLLLLLALLISLLLGGLAPASAAGRGDNPSPTGTSWG